MVEDLPEGSDVLVAAQRASDAIDQSTSACAELLRTRITQIKGAQAVKAAMMSR